MAWNAKENGDILTARLRFAGPDVVYAALREYGEFMWESGPFNANTELETALAQRKEPLIRLGLAEFGGVAAVVRAIYNKSLEGTGDESFAKAIRLAVLANRNARDGLYNRFVSNAQPEVARLLAHGSAEELRALLANPLHGPLLESLYETKGEFAAVPPEKLPHLVRYTHDNPALYTDRPGEDAPDLTRMGIHSALWRLVMTAPVTSEWGSALHAVLPQVAPVCVMHAKSVADVEETFKRWAPLKIGGWLKKEEEREGYYTSLSMAEELRVLIAALWGQAWSDKKFVIVGSADDSDLLKRCAYYGNAPLKPEQMEAGREKDGDAFRLAALFNDNVLRSMDSRSKLEKMLSREMSWTYMHRCKQLAAQYTWFNLGPITEEYPDEPRQAEAKRPAAAEAAQVQALVAQVATLQTKLDRLSKSLWWAVAVVVGASWYFGR